MSTWLPTEIAENSIASVEWEEARGALNRMGADRRANKESVALSLVLVDALRCQAEHPPVPTLDADGDVVLTWHRGKLKGSTIVANDRVSSIVSDGRRIAYIGQEQVVNALAFDSQEIVGFGGAWECRSLLGMTKSKLLTTSKSSGDKFSFPTWLVTSGASKAYSVTHPNSSSKLETDEDSSP